MHAMNTMLTRTYFWQFTFWACVYAPNTV